MDAEYESDSHLLTELARTGAPWLLAEGPESDIVISTRVRLARNLAGYMFVSRSDDQTRQQIITEVRQAVPTTQPDAFTFVDVSGLSDVEAQLLVERQLISRELAQASGPRGVIISPNGDVSVMVNEEDHMRIQLLSSGFQVEDSWQRINQLDDELESQLHYAFDPSLGYLTACPTNVGTGIRVSVMLHLPGLRITREIQKVYQAAQKINLAVRGLYGEGSQAMGDFYQVSNQVTLGCSEQEILDSLADVVPNILGYERRVRELLRRENKSQLEDTISRAMGVLTSARSITSEETMHLLSSVRLGVNLGLIDDVHIGTVNELFIQTQPSHLQVVSGQTLDSDARNESRATYLRERLNEQQ